MSRITLRMALSGAVAAWTTTALAAPALNPRACELGAYRSPGGDVLSIVRRDHGYRYYLLDGRFGDPLDPASGLECGKGQVIVHLKGVLETWPKIPIRTRAARFRSGAALLAGLLIEPPRRDDRHALVVLAHGGERLGWINNIPYTLAAQGISVFVYDKRGTGRSGGRYTQNVHLLAKDLHAASTEAKALAKGRYSRFGLAGYSQGGWVAPRAALLEKPDFLVIGFGGVFNPLEEDAEQIRLELQRLGYGAETIAQAAEVTTATGKILQSHFQLGFTELARVRNKYGSQPWFSKIRGEFTGDVLQRTERQLRSHGRTELDNLGIDWSYDSMSVLRRLAVPTLWILAGQDEESPGRLTRVRLAALQSEGKPIEVVVFPQADHGIVEFTTAPDGSRTPTRFADGFFRLMGDWMRCRYHPPYGTASFDPPALPPGRLPIDACREGARERRH